jgi:catechol 2,3-dioxygenase
MPGLDGSARIGRVRLRVADIERSLEFYRDVLGFDVAGRAHGLAALKVPDVDGTAGRELIVLEERPGLHHRPRRPVTTGLYHVAILFPDRGVLGRALRRLNEREYPLRGASDHAVSESVYLDDPDGNGLELYADRPREQWPYRGNEVQMTIDPFDLDGVMRAAGDPSTPWSLPVTTKVGHVHFTVSSLPAAERFYAGAIGFDVTQRSIPSLLAVSAGGYHHHVNLNVWAGEGAPRDRDDVAGLIEWELVIDDPEERNAVERRLSASGYGIQRDETTLRAADDDGNVVVVRGS